MHGCIKYSDNVYFYDTNLVVTQFAHISKKIRLQKNPRIFEKSFQNGSFWQSSDLFTQQLLNV
jgi:hypothetical protein